MGAISIIMSLHLTVFFIVFKESVANLFRLTKILASKRGNITWEREKEDTIIQNKDNTKREEIILSRAHRTLPLVKFARDKQQQILNVQFCRGTIMRQRKNWKYEHIQLRESLSVIVSLKQKKQRTPTDMVPTSKSVQSIET